MEEPDVTRTGIQRVRITGTQGIYCWYHNNAGKEYQVKPDLVYSFQVVGSPRKICCTDCEYVDKPCEPEDKAFWVRITNKGRCLGTNWHTTRTDEAYFVKPYTLDKYVVVNDPHHQSKFIYHDNCERIEDPCVSTTVCPDCKTKSLELQDALKRLLSAEGRADRVGKQFVDKNRQAVRLMLEMENTRERNARSTALINTVYEQLADKDRQLALKESYIQSLLEEKGVLDTSLEAKSRHVETLERDLANKVQNCEYLGKSVDYLEKQLETAELNAFTDTAKELRALRKEKNEEIDHLYACAEGLREQNRGLLRTLDLRREKIEDLKYSRDVLSETVNEQATEIAGLRSGVVRIDMEPALAKQFFIQFPEFSTEKPPKKKSKAKAKKKVDNDKK